MKYFKYKNTNKIKKIADKEYLSSLGKDKEQRIIKSRRQTKFLSCLGFISFVFLYSLVIYLLMLIPKPKSTVMSVFYGLGCIFLAVIMFIVCIVIIVIPFDKLINKVKYDYPKMRREFMAKACESIRIYYGLTGEYLLTKCFFSSNDIFINHDICIFKVEEELRITTDIVNGFINNYCDLGCYSIKFDDLRLFKDDFKGKRCTVLEFDENKFIMGIKAYSFISKLMVNNDDKN